MASLTSRQIGPLRSAHTLGLSVAGAESTVAIGVRRLGHTAAWIGRVGDDELGALVVGRLRAEGIDVHSVTDPNAPTGMMIKERRAADIRRVHYYRTESAGSHLHPDDLPTELLANSRVLHCTGITPALSRSAAEAVRAAIGVVRAAGGTVTFDANYRARLWPRDQATEVLRELTASADIVFAGEDEAQMIVGTAITGTDAEKREELAAALTERGPATAVVTSGAAGAVSVGPAGTVFVDSLPVTEVDPIGAGDSFVAGYIAALLDDADERTRMTTAASVAAMSVATQGDWEGLPSPGELALLTATEAVTR